jgi:hypothetical protein
MAVDPIETPAVPAAAAPFDPDMPTESLPVTRARRPRRALWLVAGAGAAVVLAAALAAALAGRADPTLVVENRLAGSIALTLNDSGYTISAGDSIRIAVPRGKPVEAHWAVVQPAAPDGKTLGLPVEGAIIAERVRGVLREVVDAENRGEPWFVPVLVNRTGRPLGATILTAADSFDCGCVIAPDDSIHLGYYPLDSVSAVRVRDRAGGMALYGQLDDRRNPVTGTVLLRVDSASLRASAAPAEPAARRRTPERRAAGRVPPRPENPLGTFLPVR